MNTAATNNNGPLDYKSGPTLAIASLAAMATYLDSSVLFVAFPDITDSYAAASTSTLSWVLNAYTITFAALLVPAGKLADRIGARKALLQGSLIFTVASMVCGLSPSIQILVLARVLQGAGAAVLVPSSLALVLAAFPREKLPQVVAIWGAIGAFSAALGPSLGGVIVNGLGWRWIFFLNLPIGVVTLGLGPRYLREARNSSVRVPNVIGIALVALAAGVLSFAIVNSNATGWASPQTLLTAILGLTLLGLFVLHQKRTQAPTLDLELFALRNFRWGVIAMFIYAISFGAMFFGSLLFMVEVWQWSILKAGFAIAPGPALVAILATLFGRLAVRVGQRPLILAGGLLLTLSGLYWLTALSYEANYWVGFAPPFALVAVSIALIFPQVTSVAAQALPADRSGVGSAAIQAVRQFGQTFGVALTLAFVGSSTHTRNDLFRDFDQIWWALVILGVLTTLCGIPLVMDNRESATKAQIPKTT
ncbi:MAG: DHA2 family efflux MFS transporter permease subunit [Actinomycetota bacterium]|nr:DHA2 family efflux MFS transporter permease subunit [Actinomycetota bacterium]